MTHAQLASHVLQAMQQHMANLAHEMSQGGNPTVMAQHCRAMREELEGFETMYLHHSAAAAAAAPPPHYLHPHAAPLVGPPQGLFHQHTAAPPPAHQHPLPHAASHLHAPLHAAPPYAASHLHAGAHIPPPPP